MAGRPLPIPLFLLMLYGQDMFMLVLSGTIGQLYSGTGFDLAGHLAGYDQCGASFVLAGQMVIWNLAPGNTGSRVSGSTVTAARTGTDS